MTFVLGVKKRNEIAREITSIHRLICDVTSNLEFVNKTIFLQWNQRPCHRAQVVMYERVFTPLSDGCIYTHLCMFEWRLIPVKCDAIRSSYDVFLFHLSHFFMTSYKEVFHFAHFVCCYISINIGRDHGHKSQEHIGRRETIIGSASANFNNSRRNHQYDIIIQWLDVNACGCCAHEFVCACMCVKLTCVFNSKTLPLILNNCSFFALAYCLNKTTTPRKNVEIATIAMGTVRHVAFNSFCARVSSAIPQSIVMPNHCAYGIFR